METAKGEASNYDGLVCEDAHLRAQAQAIKLGQPYQWSGSPAKSPAPIGPPPATPARAQVPEVA